MGLLSADADANLLDPDRRMKSPEPVLTSSPAHSIFGPGHNNFALAKDDETVMLLYHPHTDTAIEGNPLWNPDRHTFVKPLHRDENGMPVFCDAALSD